jgi:hypothetical protein
VRPTVHYVYDGQPAGGATRAPLTIDSQQSQVEGIRFVIDGRGTTTPVAALVYRKGREHRIKGCEFLQAGAPDDRERDRHRLASVVLEAPDGSPHLIVQQCAFLGAEALERQSTPRGEQWLPAHGLGGQNAIARRGRGRVEADNCAFGPHDAVFRLAGTGPEDEAMVTLRHCSVQAAARSAVFDLADGARARIDVTASLFSRPGEGGLGMMGEANGALVLRQTARPAEVNYQGKDNRFHNLDGYRYVADSGVEPTWEDWRQIGEGADSRELRASPWRSPEPLRLLEQLRFADAFRVDARLADVRLNDNRDLAGVEVLGEQSYLKDLAAALHARPAEGRTLVLDPQQADLASGVYATLDQVIAVLRPGDVVLIRHNGDLKLDPVSLSRKELGNVTLKPHPGYHPVLTLKDTAAGEADTALFRVYDGQLKLEGLEFRLRPGRDEVDAQALVALAGDGQCALKGCVVTLDRSGRKAALAVASLPERGKVMPSMEMTPVRSRDQGPRLRIDTCFIRGEGDLLWARASRPSELDVKNSLVALSGSLLKVEAAREGAPTTGAMVARLSQVTTYLQGNLLRVQAGKDLKGLTPLQVKPSDCLFLAPPPSAERVLVLVEGPEVEETALRGKLSWGEDGGRNGYGGFGRLLLGQASEEGKMVLVGNKDHWPFSGEPDSDFSAQLPPGSVAVDAAFTSLVPGQFKPAEAASAGFGADVATLPWPHRAGPARPSASAAREKHESGSE